MLVIHLSTRILRDACGFADFGNGDHGFRMPTPGARITGEG